MKSVLSVVLLSLCANLWAENLLPDPSFEETKAPDMYGTVFAKWGGWNYNYEAARFEVGTIARTGKSSCLLLGDPGCRIAINTRELKLEPGRYRLQFFMRGQDIQRGEWKQSITVALTGRGGALNKTGTFGWTPVTLVLDVSAEQAKDSAVRITLKGGGRLWLDDVSLEKVSEDVALVTEPLAGEAEGPFLASAAPTEGAILCQTCGYRQAPAAKSCLACGGTPSPLVQEKIAPPVKLLADFENGKKDPFRYGKIVSDNAPQGTKALLIDAGNTSIATLMDWSQHDYLRMDVFNPKDEPVELYMELRDPLSKGYWGRVNLNLLVAAGSSTLSLTTHQYVGEKSRPGRNLDREKVSYLYLAPKSPIVIDNVRLERESRPEIKGTLWAFDFGKLDSPVMEGYRQATPALLYCAERGFGWQKPRFWKTFNALQPDALFQDYITVEGGSFRVDVPNGKYQVWINIDGATGFWGENQAYHSRKLTANGQFVVDEQQQFGDFIKKLFVNSHSEVLPGIDTFESCVQKMFKPKEFEVEVTQGKLELSFEGINWSHCLSALVIYPAGSAEGKQFLEWTTQRRRAQFNDYFKQIEPKKTPAPTQEYVLFTRHFMKPVNPYDGPKEGESIPADGLTLTVAPGEEMPVSFALQPGAELGAIELKLSEFKSDSGGRLPASALQPGWLDYRISRIAADGASYSVQPRYWHPTPAPAAKGVTRRFWIRVRTPLDTRAGTYKGQITVQPAQGRAQSIALSLRVLPLPLDEVGPLAVGPWGIWINPGNWSGPEAQAWRWTLFEKSLKVLRQDGWTTFTDLPAIKAKAANGKVEFDFSLADKQMQAARAAGFKHLVGAYGSSSSFGYSLYGKGADVDLEAAKAAGFADFDSFLKAIWEPIDQHAGECNWLPVAYHMCDEPLGERIARSAKTALAHRKIPELQQTFFMGDTSLKAADPKDLGLHGELVKALPIAVLNGHDAAAIKLIAEAGGRFGYYNDGDRFSNGRYMWMLSRKHNLTIRLNWHFNVVAGDPYYDLDGREEDYCWFNSDEQQNLVPNVEYLCKLLPGLNDYRYLVTLERLVKEKPEHAAAVEGQRIIDAVLALEAGKDRKQPWNQAGKDYTQVLDEQRNEVIEAIVKLLGPNRSSESASR